MPSNSWVGPTLVIVWVLFCTGISFLMIKAVVNSTWLKIAKAHPGVEPAPDAVRRNFQSFKMNLLNLGLCVHVSVDDAYLHLYPAAFIRWFGARPASVPWAAVEHLGPAMMRSHKAKIEGVMVWGPAWCLKLASNE